MAEKNKNGKLTPFQQEQIDVAKKIVEYKLSTEANVVSIIYKSPEILYGESLDLELFSNNIWKVYYSIATAIILQEKNRITSPIFSFLFSLFVPKMMTPLIFIQKNFDFFSSLFNMQKKWCK